MINYTKDETIKLVNDFISKNKLNITLQEIELLVYEAEDHNIVIQVWLNECEKLWLEFNQNLIDLIISCWNNFPHKSLWWKSPNEFWKK